MLVGLCLGGEAAICAPLWATIPSYDGPGYGTSGMGTLTLDGALAAQGKIERTIPVRFSLDETFDAGEDTGTPVIEDYANKMPFRFTGTLNKVVVTLGK